MWVRAIAGCAVPVLTGIGHETDSTVADAVAAGTHKTPTACAAELVEWTALALDRVDRLWDRAAGLAGDRLRRGAEEHLDGRAAELAASAHRRLDRAQRSCDDARGRVATTSSRVLERAEHRVALARTHCEARDPERALARGWTLTRTTDGTPVRSVDQLAEGVELRTRLADGAVTSTVTGLAPDTTSSGREDDT
ncbi:MAG: exodeoxyribonuclease VII large subunit [Acidimicrobiia bacterium]|nr:exodeoxyribonuclease VII large subunit [Acidimicrobiia bacterium]